MAIYPLLQPRKLWTLSHIVLRGRITIGSYDLRHPGTSEWEHEEWLHKPSLAPTNLCCWEKCAYSGCPIHATRFQWEGVGGVLSQPVWFHSLTFLDMHTIPTKPNFSFEYHCWLMKPSCLRRMRYLNDTFSKGHLLSVRLGTQKSWLVILVN